MSIETDLQTLSSNKCFGGWQTQYCHGSRVLQCNMRFSVYLPPQASDTNKVPVVYWLSGLTCTDENFSHKSGAQRYAAELGLALVIPDTSPRGEGVADDPEGAYDLGLGAGFYVNATQSPWAEHYHMYDYILHELPELIERALPVSSRRAVSGHSMGGHGALVIGLRNADRYQSVSAFSPIANPINCPWGEKAFAAYLGSDRAKWRDYDAAELLKQHAGGLPILVDQGDADNFLTEQLKPDAFTVAATASGAELELRMQSGYDHSYYFIASFIEDHLRFHGRHLLD